MTRKTVIFIVEGNTDKTALENIFRKIYKNKNINVEVTQGDITSDAAIKDEVFYHPCNSLPMKK